jgi:hypothetical protein
MVSSSATMIFLGVMKSYPSLVRMLGFVMVLSVFAPLSWASFGLRHQHSSCCQDSEDNRGFPHMPPAPHCGGNMLAHMGSASKKVSQFVIAAAVACR